jgi:hypothetical protein
MRMRDLMDLVAQPLPENMRNSNWVCFKDRKVVRRGGHSTLDTAPVCPACHERMINAGDQVPVPRATDARGWRTFETEIRQREAEGEARARAVAAELEQRRR